MVVNSIFAAIATAVTNSVVTTDAGSASQFAELVSGDLEEVGQERDFTVDLVGLDKIDGTGTSGKSNRTLRVVLRVKYINEGRSRGDFAEIVVQDAVRLQDRVESYVDANVSGVGVCYSDNSAQIRYDSSDQTVAYLEIPFVVEFTETLVTA